MGQSCDIFPQKMGNDPGLLKIFLLGLQTHLGVHCHRVYDGFTQKPPF